MRGGESGRRPAAIPTVIDRLLPRRWVLALLVVLAAAAPSSAPSPAAECPVRRRAAAEGECDCTRGRVKVLHVTRHGGLEVEVRATLQHLCCVDAQTFAFNDGVNLDGEEAGLNYNVHARRAELAWEAHGDLFQMFDAILVSDVTAMARPFLQQHNFSKPLLIWVCNRFDFANQDHEFELAHEDMLQHGYFPDEAYYALMRKAARQTNVSLLMSNGFEAYYAEHWRGVDWSKAPILYPAGLGGRRCALNCLSSDCDDMSSESCPGMSSEATAQKGDLLAPGLYGGHTLEKLPRGDVVADTILVPDRGIVSGTCPSPEGVAKYFMNNEANFGVPQFLREQGFAVYHGRYDSAEHAARFKAMIRIPNNYMTTAFHQLLAAGTVMFVPSPAFLLQLSEHEDFWWNTHWDVDDHRAEFEEVRGWRCPEQLSTLSADTLHFAYEYDQRHAAALIYFDSWHDLELKLRSTDFAAVRAAATDLSRRLAGQVLEQWAGLLCTHVLAHDMEEALRAHMD